MTAAHPLAPYSTLNSLRALLLAVLAVGLWYYVPAGFTADTAVLLLAYAFACGMLVSARSWRNDAVLLIWLLMTLAVSTVLARWLTGYFHAGLGLHGPWGTDVRDYVISVLCVLILPGLIRRWLAWREARVLAEQAERHAAERTLLEARLAALQGQIEPHFLYNTLANVQYLMRRDGERADQMLDRLIAYLRAALPELRQQRTTLGQEIERVRAYLDIMVIRMGERLRYRIDCPSELTDQPLPPLALATLVENALQHGLEPKPGGGCITITARRDAGLLRIEVCDDGVGFSETGAGGVGLRNLRERLALQFGEQASLVLEARDGGGVRACLGLPWPSPAS